MTTFQKTLLGAVDSNRTSGAYFVGDALTLTLSIESSTASASRYTIWGSNGDGFQSSIGSPPATVPAQGWSLVTALTGQGMYVIDPGFRWLGAIRDAFQVSSASNTTITLAGQYL